MKKRLITILAICALSGTAFSIPVFAEETGTEEVDMDSLTEEEYKEKCKEMWYEDITFSDKSLEGEYVKVELYIQDNSVIDPYDLMMSDKTEEYNLDNECCLVGIYSKDKDSYGSGNDVGILFSKDYDFKSSDYTPGTYLTLYGKIIDYGIDYWSGHNSAWFMPKYIEDVMDVK